MLLKVNKKYFSACFLFMVFLISAGCSKSEKDGNEVYRILHGKQIVKIDSMGPGLAKFQIKRGTKTVFSYNKIETSANPDTIVNRSESIIFQIPPNIGEFDYTGVAIDSSHAFYMTDAPKLMQYPVSGGEIKGHMVGDKKWQIELNVNIKTNGSTISRHVKHEFSVSPYGEDSLQSFSRKPQIGQ